MNNSTKPLRMEMSSAMKSKFVMENDPAKRQERLEDAYSDIMRSRRGVAISDEVLNRYKNIYNTPKTKLKNTIKNYYENTLKKQTVEATVKNGVIAITFGNDGKKKAVGWRMNPEKAATFEYLKPLLETSTYAYSAENRDPEERVDVPMFHYFVNNANIGGIDVPIKITVRELSFPTRTEHRYYTHDSIKRIGE